MAKSIKVTKHNYDIIIVGAGLVGASLAIALSKMANTGLKIALIEARPLEQLNQPDFDARSIALSVSSQRILDSLGVWQPLKTHCCAINRIHVSQQGRFGTTELVEDNALGHVAEIFYINQALSQQLDHDNISLLQPATVTELSADGKITLDYQKQTMQINAKLIVAADGANSSCRKLLKAKVETHPYHQHALVTNIALNRPHHQVAYERFTADGPIAMLPLTKQRSALVWVNRLKRIEQLLQLDDNEFLQQLQQHFGYRLGRFVKCGTRHSFALAQQIMPNQVFEKTVFIGNAAHSLHPIAGQGFNLGLRDVAMLAQCIHQKGLAGDMLSHYQELRNSDHKYTMGFTHQLVSLFTNKLPGVALGRSIALTLLDTLEPAKHYLSQFATGLTAPVPDMACGLPLGECHD